VLALTAWVVPARAQQAPRDPIAAEALFERGKQLVEQGRTAEACEAFAESQRLDPAGGTLLRLALCHEAQGKLASAWLEYLEVERISKEGAGEPAKLQERVRIAHEHLASIEPRVPKLVIVVPPQARLEGLRVTANGLPRDAGTWGVALPVDPGDVTIAASAPSHQPFRETVHVSEGQQQNVELPLLAPATATPDAGAPAPAHASPTLPPAHASALRPTGIAVGAAGVVALGVGTYFGLHAIAKWNDANAICPGSSCPDPRGVSLAHEAHDSALAADVTLAAGAVAVVAGVILYVLGAPTRTTVGLAF
jgi:hypothetical protein